MEQALALGSVLLAALGAGCCVVGRRPDPVIVTAMALMVLAMLDTMVLGSVLLGPLAWTVVLAGCGLGVGVVRRHRPQGFEHAAHLGVMALLIAPTILGGSHGGGGLTGTMAADGMPGMSHAPGSATSAAHSGAATGLLIIFEVVVACGWSGRLLGLGVTCSGPVCAERVAGAASLLAMAAMAVLGQH